MISVASIKGDVPSQNSLNDHDQLVNRSVDLTWPRGEPMGTLDPILWGWLVSTVLCWSKSRRMRTSQNRPYFIIMKIKNLAVSPRSTGSGADRASEMDKDLWDQRILCREKGMSRGWFRRRKCLYLCAGSSQESVTLRWSLARCMGTQLYFKRFYYLWIERFSERKYITGDTVDYRLVVAQAFEGNNP